MKTVLLKLDPKAPSKAKIRRAALILRKGGLVAFPTETVYGLGANLMNKCTVERLYCIKKRPRDKAVTVHVADLETLTRVVGRIPRYAKKLIEEFWPGPLTLVLKDRDGNKTGFRIPDNRIASILLKEAGVPVVAPSANISGKAPPKNAREVLEDLGGKIEMVLDGGRTKIGIASTVVDATGRRYKILREGAISKEEIRQAVLKNYD